MICSPALIISTHNSILDTFPISDCHQIHQSHGNMHYNNILYKSHQHLVNYNIMMVGNALLQINNNYIYIMYGLQNNILYNILHMVLFFKCTLDLWKSAIYSCVNHGLLTYNLILQAPHSNQAGADLVLQAPHNQTGLCLFVNIAHSIRKDISSLAILRIGLGTWLLYTNYRLLKSVSTTSFITKRCAEIITKIIMKLQFIKDN